MKTKNFLKKYLLPRFDEQSLFLMGLSFFGLLPIDAQFRDEFFGVFTASTSSLVGQGGGEFYFIIWLLIAVIGMITATYHVFSKSKKSEQTKSVLLT